MIVVLTYDAPHRKTEDVLWRLLSSGVTDIQIVTIPWIERKPRRFLYPHRPGESGWPSEAQSNPTELAKVFSLGITATTLEDMAGHLEQLDPEVVVIGGAQLLPEAVVNGFKVLNVHPGLLPYCRGLDILKWSILEMSVVGVTAHLCDERADLGRRIVERKVPLYPNDTFHAFAQRQYEYEINLLPTALSDARHCSKDEFDEIPELGTESRKRMPRRIEAGLLPAFERYKLVYAS